MINNQWRKSSYSALQDCVEVRQLEDKNVELRDSKAPEDGTITFSDSEWSAFLSGIKAGEFDIPDDPRSIENS